MNFFRHMKDVVRFMQLPHELKRLTFYSEGKNYWPDLGGMIEEILQTSDISICYISSDSDDPGLLLKHDNYHTFKIDEGFIRNWFFENIETDILVMTMPDLNQYQIKKSKYTKVHYVYTQHALGSLHMTYRKGAFDYYDTIFCAGPHHVKEIRAMEAKYNLVEKNIVEHGSARLDIIIKEIKNRPKKINSNNKPKHILVAPTWGKNGTIESGLGYTLVDLLLAKGYEVTLRPHPETIKLSKNKIDKIVKKHFDNKLFHYEINISTQESLHKSDILISDWSGVALDYAFGLNKPVFFMDVPRKINNDTYKELIIEPFEVTIRNHIGSILNLEDIDILNRKNEKLLNVDKSSFVYNLGKSNQIASKYLLEYLDKVSKC